MFLVRYSLVVNIKTSSWSQRFLEQFDITDSTLWLQLFQPKRPISTLYIPISQMYNISLHPSIFPLKAEGV